MTRMTYRDALDYIYSLTNFEITPIGTYSSKTLDLTRVERLLAALGAPQTRFKSVHVAGTKGKGSTCAMLESALRAAGHRTGLYTSPHLHTFRERIRVAGAMISQYAVAARVEKIKPLADAVPGITTFEVMTALAFDYFAARGVEIAIIEVGLGGRLDATNVILPLVSVITSLSFDHTAILGNTLAQIAREKAGIIKANVPVVCAPQRDEATSVIEQVAREQNAPLIAINSALEFQVSGSKFQVVPKQQNLKSQQFILNHTAPKNLQPSTSNLQPSTFNLPLLGKHQLTNAATALAAIETLRQQGIAISVEAVREGLATVKWQGRFEILARHPFLIVDGAHNADSARQLVETIRSLFPRSRIHFIFGASSDKDIAGMFDELLPGAASLILTRSQHPRAAAPAQLSDIARARGNSRLLIGDSRDLAAALHHARQHASRGDVICVTGSLFVVADARAALLAERGARVEKDP
jgi:dihydrofolate synthase/folylpolyglutamate synthase